MRLVKTSLTVVRDMSGWCWSFFLSLLDAAGDDDDDDDDDDDNSGEDATALSSGDDVAVLSLISRRRFWITQSLSALHSADSCHHK